MEEVSQDNDSENQKEKNVISKGKKRIRPRTKNLRIQLKTMLENTILNTEESRFDELFTTLVDGTRAAPLNVIFSHLTTEPSGDFNAAKFAHLSPQALISLSNISRIFRISKKPMSISEKVAGDLWLLIKSSQRLHREERTVYVDNLPAKCTLAKLERRCAQFGVISGIHFPKIERIQRRIAHSIGGQWPVHSGFAFVQFVSKTAAKRFCKRYAMNSRLMKRTHHHTRHHTKRNRTQKPQTGEEEKQADLPNTSSTLMADESAETISYQEEVLIAMNTEQFDNKNHQKSSDVVAPSNSAVRNRCYSVAESTMSVDESGRETDQEEKSTDVKNPQPKGKSKKRNRRKRRPYPANYNRLPHTSLNNLFRHIQAFPLKQYKELRAQYMKLKSEQMANLKNQLKELTEEPKQENWDTNKTVVENRNADPKVHLKQSLNTKERKGRHRRKRGMQRLMERAEKAKHNALKKEENI